MVQIQCSLWTLAASAAQLEVREFPVCMCVRPSVPATTHLSPMHTSIYVHTVPNDPTDSHGDGFDGYGDMPPPRRVSGMDWAVSMCTRATTSQTGSVLVHLRPTPPLGQSLNLPRPTHPSLPLLPRQCSADRVVGVSASGRMLDAGATCRVTQQTMLLGPRRPRPHKIWRKKFIKARHLIHRHQGLVLLHFLRLYVLTAVAVAANSTAA